MTVDLADERAELRDGLRRFMQSKSSSADVRRQMQSDEGYDREVWAQMARELGLQGLHLPEEHGGQGFSFVELGIVLEEMGRSLLCAPYFASVCLGATAIVNSATADEQAELLPGIAAGERVATLASAEASGRWDAPGIAMEVGGSDGSPTLSGTKLFVVDGASADDIVVVAREAGTTGDDGIGFFVVDGGAPGLVRTPLETLDPTRRQARLDFDQVPARALGTRGEGAAALATTLDQAAVCLASEMLGGAQRVLEMAVEYAKDRQQFGRPIGSFQVIKHRCADLLIEVESARSAAWHAARLAAEADAELPVAACVAKAYCSDAFVHAAAENIQIHGGVGFTWEHDAHLYFKRAKSSEMLLGDPTHHRELLVQRLGL
jgi:alkylation response protein AidB-like acyl-CoA dehydrogenase